MKEKVISFYKEHSGTLIIRLLAAWCLTASGLMLFAPGTYKELEGYSEISLALIALIAACSFALFSALHILFGKRSTDFVALAVSFGLYSAICAYTADSWYTVFAFGAFWVILFFYYANHGFPKNEPELNNAITYSVITAAALIFIIFVGATGILRYRTFSAPNFDFGIFCNMYHNMKSRLTPFTTCERDTYLSHFNIHISPIFYTLLPVYAIFPSGAALQLCQSLLLASGAVPVYLIAKKYGFTNFRAVIICAVFSLSPVLAGGTNYDFHENCFLVPLLLWMFYFFEKQKYVPFGIFALLTLLVKEDAAVYVAMFALFMIFDRKKVLPGIITGIGAVLYFAIAVKILSTDGNGVMTNRYANLITGDGGFIEIVKNVLADPAYVLSQLFMSKDGSYSDKLLFILQMTVPLVFLPFSVKKPSRLILLFPMLLFNLMTFYPYQYEIGYQYAFGSCSFLFYLSIINLSEKKAVTVSALTNAAAVITALCFIFSVIPKSLYYFDLYFENREKYSAMENALSEIPKDKSVVCSTFLLPHLSDRDKIYELEYHDTERSGCPDYVIFDMRYSYDKYIKQYEELGYAVSDTLDFDGKKLLVIMQPEE